MRVLPRVFMSFLILAILLPSACSDNPVDPGDDTELSDDLIVLDDPPMRLTSATDGAFVFKVTGTPPTIEEGDLILVNSGPRPGLFGRVTSTSTVEDYMTVYVTEANLTEVVVNCKVDETIPIDIKDPGSFGFLAPEAEVVDGKILLTDLELYDDTVSVGEIPADLEVVMETGAIEFIDPVLKRGYTIRNSELTDYYSIREATIRFTCGIRTEASMSLSFPGVSLDMNMDVLTTTQRVSTSVPFPMTHCIKTGVIVGIKIDSLAVGVTTFTDLACDFDTRSGSRWTSTGGWSAVRDLDMTAPPSVEPQVSATLGFGIKPYLQFTVQDDLYCLNRAGVEVGIIPYMRFAGSLTAPPDVQFCLLGKAGCDVGVAASISLLDEEDDDGDGGGDGSDDDSNDGDVGLEWTPDPFLSTSTVICDRCW